MPANAPNNAVCQTDIAIIGAGPVGLFAIFQCGMLGLSCHVFDALETRGGQCQALYPEKPIYDIPAYPEIAAGDLVTRLEKQAAAFTPTYHLGAPVEELRQVGNRWHLRTRHNTLVDAAAVIIAAGSGAFGPNRPPLRGIETYENTETDGTDGNGVFYRVQNKAQFAGKRLVIAGGGDSAVDWAIELAEQAAQISMVHRRQRFRAAPESVNKLEALAASGKIELVIPYQLAALEGTNGLLTGVRVTHLDGDERTLPADALLAFFGLSMDLGPIRHWGMALSQGHLKVNPATCETSTPGIYAIGDVATYPGKLKLILCGFSEAAMAAHAAFKRARPDTALHFEYSTSRGVPKADH